jgi:deoxycytidylate deaminase
MRTLKERFFEEAKKESHLSDYEGAHLGAVAVYRDKFILARAHNTAKTNTTQYYYNKYRSFNKADIMTKPARGHCETNLWRKIRYLDINFADITIYLYRELKDGTLAQSAPCPSCEKLLRDAGIRTVCHTVNGGYIEEKFYPNKKI